jgi:hypothetical protein
LADPGVVQEPVDGRDGQRFGHQQLIERSRVQFQPIAMDRFS